MFSTLFRISFRVFVVFTILVPGFSSAQSNEFIFPSQSLPQPRGFHGTAAMGEYLYVFGGTSNTGTEAPTNTTLKARIQPNGQVGDWQPTTPLPQPRHYISNSTLVLNDVVYIVGGSSGPISNTHYNTAIFSRPLPNGTLLPWTESQPFPGEGLTTVTAVSTPGHIHIIGGLKTDSSSKSYPVVDVWTNTIYSDGSMGSWTPGPSLPFPLWFHSAGVSSGRVFVWGGLPTYKSDVVSPYMLSAAILGSGRLGTWRRENVSLPRGFYSSSASVAGPYLISFSPRYVNGTHSNDLWFCQITPTGPSQWIRRSTQIRNQVYMASAPDYRYGFIFLNGGRNKRGGTMLDSSVFFRLTPQAQRIAEERWLQAQLAHANTAAALPAPQQGQQQVTLSYLADKEVSASAIPGFQSYSAAREEAGRQKKPLVLFFSVDGTAPCEEQKNFLMTPEFQKLLPVASFAWVETREYPQLVQQLGVYRVPTWIFYDSNGTEITNARRVGVQQATDLAKTILTLR